MYKAQGRDSKSCKIFVGIFSEFSKCSLSFKVIHVHGISFYSSQDEGELEDYGIDWEGPTSTGSPEIDSIEVPETPSPADSLLSEIESTIDPLACSEEYGIDLYLQVFDMVTH